MASFIFENGSQLQASGFTSGDTLVFEQATPATLGVSFTPATSSGLSTTPDVVTLTYGTESLQFAAQALSGSSNDGDLIFLNGGHLSVVDSNYAIGGSETELYAYGDNTNASIAYGFGDNPFYAYVDGSAAHTVIAGSGDDTIYADDGSSSSGNYFLEGGDGNDTIYADGSTGNLHIYGNLEHTVVGDPDGTDSIDISDSTGSSFINGNAGNDTIYADGASGANRLWGGGDDDLIVTGTGGDSVNGNKGDDTIIAESSSDNGQVLTAHGGQGDDVIDASGTATAIDGTADGVPGTWVHDGFVSLFGDVGNDTLIAGTGIDVLTGGTGNDLFDFSTTGAAHIPTTGTDPLATYVSEITDFTSGSDHIHLAQSSVTGGVNVLTATPGIAFTTEAAAQSYAQTLLNSQTTTTTGHDVVELQVNGDTYLFSHEASNVHGGTATTDAVDTVIKLDGLTATTAPKAADFI